MTNHTAINYREEEKNESLGKYWLFFLVSVVFQVLLIMFLPSWAWVGLPFWMTFFVKAINHL